MNLTALAVAKATPIVLEPKTPTGEAFHTIITACHAHAASNVPLLHPDVPDSVHQMRVGIRRMRSALLLFKRHLWPKVRRDLNGRLSDMGSLLGPSRDWDVFGQETLPKIQRHFPSLSDFDSLCQSAEAHRRSAYDCLGRVKEEWPSFHCEHLLDGDELAVPIDEIAPELLDGVLHLAKRRSRHLNTPNEWHALRKAVKKLRYGVEFLGSLYDPKAVKSYVDHCKGVQEILGKVNDTSTTALLLEELPVHPGGGITLRKG